MLRKYKQMVSSSNAIALTIKYSLWCHILKFYFTYALSYVVSRCIMKGCKIRNNFFGVENKFISHEILHKIFPSNFFWNAHENKLSWSRSTPLKKQCSVFNVSNIIVNFFKLFCDDKIHEKLLVWIIRL